MSTNKKIYGTTLFIGKTQLETIYGTFTSYTYQDVIDQKYIMALAYGNIVSADSLYIRVHSSCLTSETLRSMDCDCVSQLYGAMSKIVDKGAGILFYLLQSGRGASYISKSRGCQLVQFMQEKITTFEAYESLGLEHDYRDYRNIKDVCIMLGIETKEVYLMTNNPNKIQKLNKFLNIKDTVSIHYPTNPFNRQYLLSKQQTGHILYYDKTPLQSSSILPLPSVEPFEPYHLNDTKRFIHCSTYYLPIEPVEERIILSPQDKNTYKDIITEFELLPSGNYLAQIPAKNLPSELALPYWFKTHVYYDIASHSEYVVLTFGDDKKIPIVRFHCEFIFNRFPLKHTHYKSRYAKSVLMSVRNNSGIIIIANHNGDNTTIGNYILHNESFESTGISPKKNLLPLTLLLKHHLNDKPIRALYSDTSRPEMEITFKKANIDVKEWICINKKDKKGHTLIRHRIDTSLEYLKGISSSENLFAHKCNFWVTGIGSSEAHAKFFVNMANKSGHFAQYVCVNEFNNNDHMKENMFDNANNKLIIISQGMSPHSILPLNYALSHNNCKNIFLLTAVTNTNKNKEKVSILHQFSKKHGNIVNYPLEDEYSVLIRIIGPLSCYFLIYHMFVNECVNNLAIVDKIKNIEYQIPPSSFTKKVKDNIVIIVPQEFVEFCVNIKYKLIEGGFLKTAIIVGDLDFAHGTYQFCKSMENNSANIMLVNCKNDKLKLLINNEFSNVHIVETYYKNGLGILELEHLFNNFVLNIIINNNIDQVNWPGKETQHNIYNN